MGCGGSKTDGTTATATTTRTPRKQGSGQGQGQGQSRGSKGRGGKKGGKEPDENNKTPRTPVREKGYKKRIRENLRQATAGDDIPLLEKSILIFENNHLEDGGDLTDAHKRMDFLLTRKDIRDACMRNHPVVLEKSVARVEASPYRAQLKSYIDRANQLLNNQNDLKIFRHDIQEMDQSTISEIRSYCHPPPGVHESMIPTYMVIGHQERDLLDWPDVTALMGRYGKESLLREVLTCDGSYVTDETAVRAKHYLNKYTLEEVREVSTGAAAFHNWSSQMIAHHESGGKKAPLTPKETTKAKGKTSAQQKSNAQNQDPKQKQQQDNRRKQEEETRKKEQQQKQQQQQQQQKGQQAQKQAKNQQNKDTKAANNTAKGNTNTNKTSAKTQNKDTKATNNTAKGNTNTNKTSAKKG